MVLDDKTELQRVKVSLYDFDEELNKLKSKLKDIIMIVEVILSEKE